VAREVNDARVLKLIRRFLEAGMMSEGLVEQRTQGTPQGGPLSPLLSNILLTDLDRALERRGLAFCRYADDCNIYVRSQMAGERVMRGVRAFLEKALHLQVNVAKSAVARPWGRKFLGFSFTAQHESRVRIALESRHRLTQRVRELQRKGRGQSLAQIVEGLNPLLRGWIAYFQIAETPNVLKEMDSWVRRRLRCVLWRQWKVPRTRAHKLRSLGLDAIRAHMSAGNHRGPWWNAGSSHMGEVLPAAYFRNLGLISLRHEQQRLQRAR
jgi:RNA-directed DNA polymerase